MQFGEAFLGMILDAVRVRCFALLDAVFRTSFFQAGFMLWMQLLCSTDVDTLRCVCFWRLVVSQLQQQQQLAQNPDDVCSFSWRWPEVLRCGCLVVRAWA